MARGEGAVQNASANLANTQEAEAQAQMARNQAMQSGIVPGFEAMYNFGGPGMQNEYEQLAEQPVATAMNSAAQKAARRVSRTGNEAGYGALQEDLAGQKAAQIGEAAQRGDVAYQNQKLQAQNDALKGLSDLYGVDTNLLGRMLGLPTSSLGVEAGAAKPYHNVKLGPIGFNF